MEFIKVPPNALSGWNKYFPITHGNALSQEKEFYFPPNKLPTSKIGIVNEYSNFALELDKYETSYTFAMAGTPGMAASTLLIGGVPVSLTVSLSRQSGYMICGGNSPIRHLQAPKFGFSIGNLIKHQAHIKLDVVGAGITGPLNSIVWLAAPCTASIEYSTNCRLEQFVLKHGKVLDVKSKTIPKTDKEPEKLQYSVKLFDSSNLPEFKNGIPSGEISFYSDRKTGTFAHADLKFSNIDLSWYADLESETIEVPKEGETKKESFIPSKGDFFTLATPILCENPQTMHEFNVHLVNGVYVTNEQKFELETKVIGIWIYDEAKALNVAYANEDKRSLIVLPDGSKDEKTMSPEEYIAKEYHAFGGTLDEGLALVSNSASIKIILDDCGSQTAQNFFSGNLIGEYIAVGNEYYEIISNPRLDTIEIKDLSVTSGSSFLKVKNFGVKIYQQKFWKITELYTTARSVTGTGALWQGHIESIKSSDNGTYNITWESIEPYSRLFLPDYEIEKTQCKTLPERFRTKINAKKAKVQTAYTQYSGWNTVINGNKFKIIDIAIKETEASSGGSDAKVSITATVEGNPNDYGTNGSDIHIIFGDQFESAIGLQGQDIPYVYMETVIGRSNQGGPALYMNGYYDAGTYSLPSAIDSQQRFAIASHFYGADSPISMWGVPRVWITTQSGAAFGVCYLEHGANGQQSVLYKDPELEIVTAVTSDPGWVERRQKTAVYLGLADAQKYETYPDDAYIFTHMGCKIENKNSTINGYFPVVPSGAPTPYHSVKVSGYGGIETPLSRKYKVAIKQTDAHPTYLPFEVYSPVNNGNGTSVISCPILSKVTSVSKYGFEEVIDGKIFEKIKQGTQLQSGTFKSATSFDFVRSRQLLLGINQFNSHMIENGEIFLFYGKSCAAFYLGEDKTTQLPSKPSVFAIKSSNNMDSWGSPKFNVSQLPDLAGYSSIANGITIPEDKKINAEWEHPMLLIYDFEFVSSLKLWGLDEFLIFGYGYSRKSDKEDPDSTSNRLFLGCYLVSSQDMISGDTQKCTLVAAKENTAYNTAVGFYHRQNHVKPATDETSHNMDFGVNIGTSSKTGSFEEKFTKIIGAKESGALIGGKNDTAGKSWLLPKETIGVECTDLGIISVYFRESQSNTIMRLWSCTQGADWLLEVEDYAVKDSPAIKYATGAFPTIYKGLLFYFYGDSLYCKNLTTVAEGSFEKGAFGSKQEQLDKITPNLIASDVVGHKIAVNTDPYGLVVVFYLDKSGDIQASTSNSNGITWTYLNNW